MISVVIPVRDGAHVLAGQLRALADQEIDEPWEVVIADNGSRDGLAEVVASWQERLPGLRIVDASGRRGASHARNVGAAVARGDRILFCDADDEVAPGWVAAMAAALRRCGAVGGAQDHRRLSPPGNLRPGSAASTALIPWPGFWSFTVGGNLGVRADVLADVGGYDESFLVSEDTELSWRLRRRGHELCFVPDAVVHHRERSGLRAVAKQTFAWGRQDPHLYQRYASDGMPPSKWRRSLRCWAYLLVCAPRYWRSAPERAVWMRSTARRVGRIVGSIEYRTCYL